MHRMITWGRNHWRDGARLLALAVVSLALGLLLNALRPRPLPWRYESPEARLIRIVQQLGAAESGGAVAIPEISLTSLRTTIDHGQALLLDARAPLFYQRNHLPGALPLARSQFADDYAALKERLATRNGPLLVVYCAGDDCHDSELVAAALIQLGHQPVRLFRGGFTAWKKAGLPLENGQ